MVEPDLGHRRFGGDAVPEDSAAAHFMVVVVIARLRHLPRDVPSEAADEDCGHHRRREGEDVAAAEALPHGDAVGLHRGEDDKVNRRQIPDHCVRDRHIL